MTETLIHIQGLPAHVPAADRQVVDLPMTATDRRRVRRRLVAPDGQHFALALPTGSVLPIDHPLYVTDTTLYRITAAAEEVLVISPRNIDEAALVGHLIGNLHRDVDIVDGQLIALWDAPLEQKLHRTEVPCVREQRPFRGRPPGEHSH